MFDSKIITATNDIIQASSDHARYKALKYAIDVLQLELDELHTKTFDRVDSGDEVCGFEIKEVEGRKTRKIKSEELAVSVLSEHGVEKDALYQSKMIGIPAIEKLLKNVKKAKRDEIMTEFVEESVSPSTKVLIVK